MSLATTIQPPSAIYREEQNFAWWVYALLALMAGVGIFAAWIVDGDEQADPSGFSIQIPLALAVGMVVPSVLIAGVLRMTTEVTATHLSVWFGWVPTFRKVVPIGEIVSVEVVTYRPIRDCGGWGIRQGPEGERVLNARGDRGVRLVLNDGSRLLIGSQRPEELAMALTEGRRTVS